MTKVSILLLLIIAIVVVLPLAGCQAVKREGRITIIDANTVTYKGHRMSLEYSDGVRTVKVDAREEGIIEGIMKLLVPWLMIRD